LHRKNENFTVFRPRRRHFGDLLRSDPREHPRLVTLPSEPWRPRRLSSHPACTDALLADFGGEFIVLAWDKTNTVPAGSLGSKEFAGHAGPAMMRLVRDVASRVEQSSPRHGREVALLTSDCLGAWGQAHTLRGSDLRLMWRNYPDRGTEPYPVEMRLYRLSIDQNSPCVLQSCGLA
jgi:hypothetical protein